MLQYVFSNSCDNNRHEKKTIMQTERERENGCEIEINELATTYLNKRQTANKQASK